jgi:hypothetical protein
MTRVGRPRGALGEIALRTLDLCTGREVHVVQVAADLQLSRRDATVALYNLRAGGYATEVALCCPLPRGSARKPVPVVTARPPATVEDKLAVLAAWPARTGAPA